MIDKSSTRLSAWIKALPWVAGAAVIAAGSIVIIGWMLHIELLMSLHPSFVSMKANTALAFVLAGMSLLFHASAGARWQRMIGCLLASLVVVVGLLSVAEYLFTWDAGIDQLLFHEPAGTIGTFLPGRMALSAAINFCLLGISLLMLELRTPRGDWFAQLLAIFVGLSGMLGLVAYVYGLSGSSGYAVYARMALHTACAFIVLSVGMIGLRPNGGILVVILGLGSGGFMARRLMFAAVVLPVILGWFTTSGETWGWYGNQFGDVINTTAYIGIALVLIWSIARSLNSIDAARLQTDKQLQESERQFKELFDDAPVGYHELDVEGRISRINQTEVRSLGYRADEMLGRFIWEFISNTEESRQAVMAKLSGTLLPARGAERIFLRKDGTALNVVIEDKLLQNSLGRTTGIRTTVQDITELKKTQNLLHETGERDRIVLESLAEGVGIADGQERFTFVNRAAETIFGVSSGNLIGRSLQEFVDPAEFEKIREQTARRQKGETASYEMQIIRLDGEKRHLLVTASPLLDKAGLVIGAIGVFRDLTERRLMDESLRATEAHFRLIVEGASDLIYNIDREGYVTSVNPATSRLLGYSPDEILGCRYVMFVRSDFRRQAERTFLIQLKRKTPSIYFEAPVLTKDGRELWFGQNVDLIVKNGEAVGYQAVSRDITEQKRAEKLAEALYSISQAIHSTASLSQLFEAIHQNVSSIMLANNFFVALVSDDETTLDFPYGRDEKDPDNWPSISVADSQSLTAEVYRSGKSLVLNEKELQDRYSSGKNRVWGTAPKCWLGVPLLTAGKTIGVMVVQDYVQDNIYSSKDLALLESAAGQIALAIERKRSEESLKKSVSVLQATLESTADGILVVDNYGKIESYNKEFARMWMLPDEVVESKDDERALNHVLGQLKDPDAFISRVRELYAHPEEKSFDLLEFRDGRVFERYSLPQRIDGNPTGRVWSFRNVTERKRAEAALAHEQYLLNSLMENVPDHIYFKDLESRFERISKAQSDRFGLSDPGEAVGKSDFDFFTDEHARSAYQDEQDIIRTGRVLSKEEKETWPDRSETWVLTTKMPLQNKEGKTIGTFGISRDVTEQKKAEQEIRLLAQTISSVEDCVSIGDLEDKIIFVNDAFLRTYGYTREELLGRPILVVRPQNAATDDKNQIRRATLGGGWYGEILNRRKDGTEFPVELWTSPVRDGTGTIVATVGIARDIADRKNAERERESLISELTAALEKVKTLGGLLPICASCKKIRDDKGYWNQLEKYLGDHTDAKLTHGLCPDCAKLYFPDAAAKAGL